MWYLDNWIGYTKLKKGKDSVRLLIAGGFGGRTTSHTQVTTSLEMLREEIGLIPSSLNFVFDLRNVFNGFGGYKISCPVHFCADAFSKKILAQHTNSICCWYNKPIFGLGPQD